MGGTFLEHLRLYSVLVTGRLELLVEPFFHVLLGLPLDAIVVTETINLLLADHMRTKSHLMYIFLR